jgi:hypothetical protein
MPSTVTVTKTVASSAAAFASIVTVSQSGVTKTVTASPSTGTVTITLPQPDLRTTVTATASASTGTVTITVPQSGVAKTVTVTTSALTGTVTITLPPSSITPTVTATTTITAVTTITATSPAGCTNPAINGGFEAGTLDWTFSNANPGFSFTTEASTSIPDGAHSGSYAGAFVSDGGPFLPGIPVDIYQTISGVGPSCASSGKYQISMFVKTVSNNCFINLYNDINAQAPVVSIQVAGGGSDPLWSEIVAPVSMPLQNGLTFAFEASCNTQDTVWFDDITMMPIQ